MHKMLKVAGLLLVAGLITVPAQAGTLDFDNTIFLPGGSLSYDGLGGPLVGTAIAFDRLNAEGTLHDGGYACVGCFLNFTTGSFAGSAFGADAWNAGGTFVLFGAVPLAGVPLPSVLLSGSFTGNPTGSFSGNFLTFRATGIDEKNPDLLDFFGLLNPFIFGQTEISTRPCFAVAGEDHAFSCIVAESDLVNTDTNLQLGNVPEPASLLLLGTGLVGIGYKVRRRMKSSR